MNQKLIDVWKDTEDLCDKEFLEQTEISTKCQKVYTDAIELPELLQVNVNPVIKVTPDDTITAAYNATGKVAILNFASATNPGGGVTKGSSAQEECICRCTNLMPCLYDSDYVWDNFYQYHRDQKDNIYTDRCVYTPKVLIFKDASYNRVDAKEINVITCAAPNLNVNPNNIYNDGASSQQLTLTDDELYQTHLSRAEQIIKCAILNKCDAIILGAFGCGAFRNNPEIVAKAWNEVIQQYKKYFSYIEFAIYCKYDKTNFEMFDRFIEQ